MVNGRNSFFKSWAEKGEDPLNKRHLTTAGCRSGLFNETVFSNIVSATEGRKVSVEPDAEKKDLVRRRRLLKMVTGEH